MNVCFPIDITLRELDKTLSRFPGKKVSKGSSKNEDLI